MRDHFVFKEMQIASPDNVHYVLIVYIGSFKFWAFLLSLWHMSPVDMVSASCPLAGRKIKIHTLNNSSLNTNEYEIFMVTLWNTDKGFSLNNHDSYSCRCLKTSSGLVVQLVYLAHMQSWGPDVPSLSNWPLRSPSTTSCIIYLISFKYHRARSIC